MCPMASTLFRVTSRDVVVVVDDEWWLCGGSVVVVVWIKRATQNNALDFLSFLA